MQITFEALGTHWWIEIFDPLSDEQLHMVHDHMELFARAFNDAYSRFLPESLVSRLNRERTFVNPPLDFVTLLQTGQSLYTRTDGACNMLVGHILESRGYDATYSFIPSAEDVTGICNPLTDLSVTVECLTLTCGNIDLGGFGKGYLIDRMHETLRGLGVEYFLINGGGDMYATSNCGEPVQIFLEHPLDSSLYIATTTLLNQGFAASSPFKRQWRSGGTIYTHIVGGESENLFASFTKARNATDADAFTKSCLLFSEEMLSVIKAREGVAFARFNHHTNELWQTADFCAC